MMDAAVRELPSTVSALSDDRLLEQTTKLALLDHEVQGFVIDHLLEIEARGLYLSRGYSNLFAYVTRGLGYSDGAAWRRIAAMKLCARVEGTRDRLRDGSITLDAAAQLQAAFERRDRNLARGARAGTAGAAKPNGRSASAPAHPPERKPAPVLDLSARKALVEQAAGKSTRQVMQMLAAVDPALAVPADRMRPLSEGRWELKAVVDEECQRGLEQLKGLISHVDPRMTLRQLVGRLVRDGLDRYDPSRPPRRRANRTPAGRRANFGAQGRGTLGRRRVRRADREACGHHGVVGQRAECLARHRYLSRAGTHAAVTGSRDPVGGADQAVPDAYGNPIGGCPCFGAEAPGKPRQFAVEGTRQPGSRSHFGVEAAWADGGHRLLALEQALRT